VLKKNQEINDLNEELRKLQKILEMNHIAVD
jgi:hypothetical protein